MELIREVYQEILQNSRFMEKTEFAVMKEIEELTLIQKNTMSLEDYEKFRGMLFRVSTIAQEEAFVAGFKYGVTMLVQSFAEKDTKES